MSEGVMQPTIQAVRCASCNRLHEANKPGYILLVGRVIEPGVPARAGMRPNTPITRSLGSENDPRVVCKIEHCIIKAITGQEEPQ